MYILYKGKEARRVTVVGSRSFEQESRSNNKREFNNHVCAAITVPSTSTKVDNLQWIAHTISYWKKLVCRKIMQKHYKKFKQKCYGLTQKRHFSSGNYVWTTTLTLPITQLISDNLLWTAETWRIKMIQVCRSPLQKQFGNVFREVMVPLKKASFSEGGYVWMTPVLILIPLFKSDNLL